MLWKILKMKSKLLEEDEFEDEKAKDEFEKLLEQYEAQGVDVSQVEKPDFNLYNCKIKRTKTDMEK